MLEGEAEVGICEGDMALVVSKDERAFNQEDGGEVAFLHVVRGEWKRDVRGRDE